LEGEIVTAATERILLTPFWEECMGEVNVIYTGYKNANIES